MSKDVIGMTIFCITGLVLAVMLAYGIKPLW